MRPFPDTMPFGIPSGFKNHHAANAAATIARPMAIRFGHGLRPASAESVDSSAVCDRMGTACAASVICLLSLVGYHVRDDCVAGDAAAECRVERDGGREIGALKSYQRLLGVEQVTLRVEDFKVG